MVSLYLCVSVSHKKRGEIGKRPENPFEWGERIRKDTPKGKTERCVVCRLCACVSVNNTNLYSHVVISLSNL